MTGFPGSGPGVASTSSRAASGSSRIILRHSMRGSSMPGSSVPDLTAPAYGTHSCGERSRRKSTKKTGNLRAVQLRPGHIKLESTVRYFGIEVDDALHFPAGRVVG